MVGYLIALLAVLCAATVRFSLDPWLSGRALYLAFMVAVFVAAMFGGPLPAVFAMALSVLCVHLLHGVHPNPQTAMIELVVFLGASSLVTWLVHLIMRLRRQSALDEGQARLREEHATRLAEERDLLIDGIPGHALVMLDVEGKVRIWSKGAERLLGWTEEEAAGRPGGFFHPGLDLPRAIEGDFTADAMLRGKDGGAHPAEVATAALRDPRERLRGYALVIRAA